MTSLCPTIKGFICYFGAKVIYHLQETFLQSKVDSNKKKDLKKENNIITAFSADVSWFHI